MSVLTCILGIIRVRAIDSFIFLVKFGAKSKDKEEKETDDKR
jgi:hypothetical protein